MVGVPIELFGAVTHRNAIDDVLCKSIAFTHTLLGKDGKPIRALNHISYYDLCHFIIIFFVILNLRHEFIVLDRGHGCNTIFFYREI